MAQESGRTPRRRGSLALRLTAWYALSSFALVLSAVGVLYWALLESVNHQHEAYFRDKVRVLEELLSRRPPDLPDLMEEVEQDWAPRQYARVYGRILDGQGRVVVESPNMADLLAAKNFDPAGPESELPRGKGWRSSDGHPYELAAVAMRTGTPARNYVIQLALDDEPQQQWLRRYREGLAGVLAAALVACTMAGYQIARRGLAPLRQISAAVEQIRPSTLDRRVDAAGLAREFRAIAETLNAMLRTMEEAFARLSRFSADLAHELRTPLAILRGEVEVALSQRRDEKAYREVLSSCLEEAVRLSQVIDALLFLARAEDPRTQVAKERVDLGQELGRVCEFYEAAAAQTGVGLRVEAGAGVTASLDRILLQRAVGNLVANALAHTAGGGQVAMRAYRENGQACVAVEDTGCGIPEADLPRVFDRFYRVDPSRSAGYGGGVGLGLAIVKGIMNMHGGSVEISSEAGKGTAVRLIFPEGN